MNNKGGSVGLVLAGGGGKGSYQIGVWKALKEYGIDTMISHVSGTSVGALNACFFAMGAFDQAVEVWNSIAVEDVLTFDQAKLAAWATKLGVLGIPGTVADSALRFFSKNRSEGFFSRNKLEQIIENEIDFVRLQNSSIKTYATCFDKSSWNAAYFNLNENNAETIKAILLATSAIPVVFESHTIQDHEYYDGGIIDNTPVSPLYVAGVRNFIVVYLSQSALVDKSRFPDSQFIEIVPQQDMGNLLSGTLNFNQYTLHTRMEAGYHDTKTLFGSFENTLQFENLLHKQIVAIQSDIHSMGKKQQDAAENFKKLSDQRKELLSRLNETII